MIIPMSLYSQEKYPKKLIIGNDTVVAISVPQLRTMNSVFVDLNEYKVKVDTLSYLVNLYKDLTINLNEKISTQDSIISRKNLLINTYSDMNDDNLAVIKSLNSKVRRTKIKAFTIGGLGVSVGITGLLLMINK
jgi:hypothetical protein